MMETEDRILERSIGERIKVLRAESGLTLERLASESGVSRAMISRIERGEASPTASLLARICAALGLSLSGFFAENEEAVSPLVKKRDQQLWKDPETGYVRRAISHHGWGPMSISLKLNFRQARVSVFRRTRQAGE